MRVAFVISAISSDNTGMGGSYRSLMALANGIRQAGIEVRIFALGDIYPISYRGAEVSVEHIEFKSALGYWSQVRRGISAYEPTHIHAFDNKSYFFARLVAKHLDVPAVLTRPGGPNPHRYFPHAADIVAFSEENATFFRAMSKLKNSSIHVIANRVTEFELCCTKESRLREELGIDGRELVVLRICRIDAAYEQSIHQAANLTRRLVAASVPARLVVLGLIQSQAAFDRLQTISGVKVDFVTTAEYTLNANELIGIGDIVVGVGRGFMEAALHGSILLAPVAGQDLPALVLASNINDLARTNFSPRGEIVNYEATENFSALLHLLRNPGAAADYSAFIRGVAKEKYAVSTGVTRHTALYAARDRYTPSGFLDHLLNFIVVARFYLPVIFGAGQKDRHKNSSKGQRAEAQTKEE